MAGKDFISPATSIFNIGGTGGKGQGSAVAGGGGGGGGGGYGGGGGGGGSAGANARGAGGGGGGNFGDYKDNGSGAIPGGTGDVDYPGGFVGYGGTGGIPTTIPGGDGNIGYGVVYFNPVASVEADILGNTVVSSASSTGINQLAGNIIIAPGISATGTKASIYIGTGFTGGKEYQTRDVVIYASNSIALTGAPTTINNLTAPSATVTDAVVTNETVTALTGTTVIIGTTLNLPTSGGTPANLNYYENAVTQTFDFTGAWTGTFTLSFQRIGTVVMMGWPTMQKTAVTATTIASTGANVIPARFRPLGIARTVIEGLNAGANTSLTVEPSTTGRIIMTVIPGPTFTGSSTAGPYGAFMSYSTLFDTT